MRGRGRGRRGPRRFSCRLCSTPPCGPSSSSALRSRPVIRSSRCFTQSCPRRARKHYERAVTPAPASADSSCRRAATRGRQRCGAARLLVHSQPRRILFQCSRRRQKRSPRPRQPERRNPPPASRHRRYRLPSRPRIVWIPPRLGCRRGRRCHRRRYPARPLARRPSRCGHRPRRTPSRPRSRRLNRRWRLRLRRRPWPFRRPHRRP
jgi:hypothetical protein